VDEFLLIIFLVSVPCARLSWPSCQLFSARKSTVPYRIVSGRCGVRAVWRSTFKRSMHI